MINTNFNIEKVKIVCTSNTIFFQRYPRYLLLFLWLKNNTLYIVSNTYSEVLKLDMAPIPDEYVANFEISMLRRNNPSSKVIGLLRCIPFFLSLWSFALQLVAWEFVTNPPLITHFFLHFLLHIRLKLPNNIPTLNHLSDIFRDLA